MNGETMRGVHQINGKNSSRFNILRWRGKTTYNPSWIEGEVNSETSELKQEIIQDFVNLGAVRRSHQRHLTNDKVL